MWQPIGVAPKDGTRILALEDRRDDEVPAVVQWYDPKSDGFDAEPCWIHSEQVLCDMTDDIDPQWWIPIPKFERS